MTLSEITERVRRIQQLAASNPQAAVEENKKLFIAMTQQDGCYLVLGQDGCPIAAPVQEGDPRRFLRVFSHEEAAKAFAEKELGREVRPIDGVELMQLAKAWFLYGAYGLLLNDGLAWAALSFPDFLTACFHTILGDDAMADVEFIAIVRLINMVRQNESYRIASDSMPDGSVILFVQEEGKEILDAQGLLALERLPKTVNIHIKVDDIDCVITADMLQGAFRVTGLADSRVPWPDFQTDFLNLDFRPEDFVQEPVGAPSEEEPPKKEERPKKKEKQPKEKSPKKERREKKPGRGSRLIYAAGGIAVAVLMVAAVAFYWHFSNPSPIESLRNDVSTQYYASVEKHYKACKEEGTAGEALQVMNVDLEERLRAYANGECEAQELKDAIDAYVTIPDMEEAAENAFTKGAIIEKSRTAYQTGLTENSVSRKLECWRDVSAEDVTSYEAMQAYLSENAAGNKYIVFQEADSLTQPDALARLLLLQSFYPTDMDIAAKIRMVRTGNTSAPRPSEGAEGPVDAAAYISISRASVHSGGWDGEVDLYIDWTNTSGREIEEVDFEVVPYDEFGEQAYTKTPDENGQCYSRYLARDVSPDGAPFAPGYTTPVQHAWEDAWVNSLISSVVIDKVSIFFAGEDVPVVITDAAVIASMFPKK